MARTTQYKKRIAESHNSGDHSLCNATQCLEASRIFDAIELPEHEVEQHECDVYARAVIQALKELDLDPADYLDADTLQRAIDCDEEPDVVDQIRARVEIEQILRWWKPC